MKNILLKFKQSCFIFFTIFFWAILNAEENIDAYKFSFYILLKGKIIKNISRYDFGYRIEKTFPLRVREFLLTSKYHNIGNKLIQNTAEKEILVNINPEYRKKNAYYVTEKVFNFVKNKIEIKDIKETVNYDVHNIFRYPSEIIKERNGNLLEKCRLAVTLLRYLTIPARISYWKGKYIVEYYMQPLKGKGHWFIMDFESDSIDVKNDYIMSVEWFPIDKNELLNEEWNGIEIFLKRENIKEVILRDDSVKENFEKFKNDIEINSEEVFKGKFYLLRKIEYELWVSKENKGKEILISFMLPFNNRVNFKNENSEDDIKTVDFFVKSCSEKLKIKYKRAHTKINPPQTGIIYYLPTTFIVEQ